MPHLQAPAFGLSPSPILDVLGRNRFTEFVAVKIPGRIVWFNFELARSLGVEIPSSNSLSAELEAQLVGLLSLRALRAGEELGQRQAVQLYADKYGGDDLGRCMGAGRAGFLSWGNLYLKGVGHTPLFRHDDPHDFEHSHGGVSMLEGMLEAVFGEVNTDLFTKGSARILALIDQDDYTIYPNGKKEPRAIVVRAGSQLRPAHLFARGVKGGYSKLELFTRIAEVTGQLTLRRAGAKNLLDLGETMLQIIDDHAFTAAEQFRWRIIHGAMSMSNMEMSGAMLDSTTESAQPRTAPLRVLTQHPDVNLVFGQEHLERVRQLQIMYRSVVKSLSEKERQKLNAQPVNFTAEMNQSYQKHLERQMLKAAGLTAQQALSVQANCPALARRFQEILSEMAVLRNRGRTNANKPPIADISVVDIFNLLQNYPRTYFSRTRASDGRIEKLLRPAFKGNRFQRAKQQTKVAELARAFRQGYADVMTAGQQFSAELSAAKFRDSIVARAAFENPPMTSIYRGNLLTEFAQIIEQYKSTGRSKLISRIICEKISNSRRNFDRRPSDR
ncbi:MAG TPA: hypothetical protein VIW64_07345 [Pyrinomonadaceae bacterium]|jgi:hypothetical protein